MCYLLTHCPAVIQPGMTMKSTLHWASSCCPRLKAQEPTTSRRAMLAGAAGKLLVTLHWSCSRGSFHRWSLQGWELMGFVQCWVSWVFTCIVFMAKVSGLPPSKWGLIPYYPVRGWGSTDPKLSHLGLISTRTWVALGTLKPTTQLVVVTDLRVYESVLLGWSLCLVLGWF